MWTWREIQTWCAEQFTADWHEFRRFTNGEGGLIDVSIAATLWSDTLIGRDVTIHAGVQVVGPNVVIDNYATLRQSAVIEDNVSIGDGVLVCENVRIYGHSVIGARARIRERVRIRDGAVIGVAATIGPGSVVHREAAVGDRVIIPGDSVVYKDHIDTPVIDGVTKI